MDAVVSTLGAEPFSAPGRGTRARTAVVVVHGFTANPVSMRPLGQALATDGFSVEVPLLPGHGTTPRDLATTRYRDWADAVDGLLDTVVARAERVVLIGHSAGGTICLDLASRRPDDVSGVVVINPLLRRPEHPLGRVAPLVAGLVPFLPRDMAGMPTNDVARADVDEHAYAYVPTRALASLLAQLPRIRSQVLDVVAPLLVVVSPQDHTVPAGNAVELRELVGSADIRELVCEHSYHLPQLDHDAARLASTVRGFVVEVSRGGVLRSGESGSGESGGAG